MISPSTVSSHSLHHIDDLQPCAVRLGPLRGPIELAQRTDNVRQMPRLTVAWAYAMQPRFAADQTSASSVEKDPKVHDSAVGYHATNGELFGKRDPMPRTSCKQPAITTPHPPAMRPALPDYFQAPKLKGLRCSIHAR